MLNKMSGSKAYKVGRRFEYYCMNFFRKEGYYCIRSAGSKGIIDFVALGNNKRVYLIQCKRDGQISKAERIMLGRLVVMTSAIVLLIGSPSKKLRFWTIDYDGSRVEIQRESIDKVINLVV